MVSLKMREKDSYDYVYIDEDNMVHVLSPLIGGDTIGLDNTCKTNIELKKFNKNIKGILKNYRFDLENDIAILEKYQAGRVIENKRYRLEQIKQYISLCSSDYKSVKKVLERKNNCVSILLSPISLDNILSTTEGNIFTLSRGNGSILRDSLLDCFSDVQFGSIDADFKKIILDSVEERFGKSELTINDGLVTEIIDYLKQQIQTKTSDTIDLTKSQGAEDINGNYLISLMYLEEEEDPKDTSKNIAEYILGEALSEDFWRGLTTNQFQRIARQRPTKRSEKLSILTQFFLAETNAYCYVNDLSKEDFGQKIEGSRELLDDLILVLEESLASGEWQVEHELIKFINNHRRDFGLAKEISDDDMQKIIDRFNNDYVMVENSPHMDEFILLFPEVSGDFVNHKNRVSTNFLNQLSKLNEFAINHLIAFNEKYGVLKGEGQDNRLPHKNQLETSGVEFDFDPMFEFLESLKNNSKQKRRLLNLLSTYTGFSEQETQKLMWAFGDKIYGLKLANPGKFDDIYQHFSKDVVLGSLIDFNSNSSWPDYFNINTRDKEGNTPLMIAVAAGDDDEVKELVVALLEKKGVDLNLQDNSGKTSLMLAAEAGYITTVKLLLDKGGKLNLTDSYDNSALVFAAQNGHVEIVELLLEKGGDLNAALIFAAKNGFTLGVELLLEKGANPNAIGPNRNTVLIWAANNGHDEIVEQLLNKGADPNLINSYKNTALIMAVLEGHAEIVEQLLNKEADPNLINSYKNTALIAAVVKGHTEIVEQLLNKGADPNIINVYKMTALLLAVKEGHTELVKLLLEKGANPSMIGSRAKKTALELAVLEGHGEVVIAIANKTGEQLYDYLNKQTKMPRKLPFQFVYDDVFSRFPAKTAQKLMWAFGDKIYGLKLANPGKFDGIYQHFSQDFILRALIDFNNNNSWPNDFNINTRDQEGNTPLMIAAVAGEDEEVKGLLVALLEKEGANLNLQNSSGKTALMLAIENNLDIELIKELLAQGANPVTADNTKHTAFTYAIEQKNMEAIRACMEYVSLGSIPKQDYKIINLMLDNLAESESRDKDLLIITKLWYAYGRSVKLSSLQMESLINIIADRDKEYFPGYSENRDTILLKTLAAVSRGAYDQKDKENYRKSILKEKKDLGRSMLIFLASHKLTAAFAGLFLSAKSSVFKQEIIPSVTDLEPVAGIDDPDISGSTRGITNILQASSPADGLKEEDGLLPNLSKILGDQIAGRSSVIEDLEVDDADTVNINPSLRNGPD